MKPDKNTVLPSCIANAVNLAGLVEYAADSVVSKTIIDKSVGTVTLFAFDAGQGLSEHQTPYDALVQIVDGSAILIIGGKDVNASAGQIVVMPANVPHAVQAKERFKMLLIMIKA
ncbi:MAG: cupin domain-containing protein [Planctomycetes bacterium]|nr:cupin domain-containing protein [Planctomycetota bacterium]MBU1518072.1 cupin domain-containing protein [Planctomycetota bacterium]MBU2458511.1 cupin domain-containing protein [Planctomycetota bacterium]